MSNGEEFFCGVSRQGFKTNEITPAFGDSRARSSLKPFNNSMSKKFIKSSENRFGGVRDSTYSRPLGSAELTRTLEKEAHQPLTPQKRGPRKRPGPGHEQAILSIPADVWLDALIMRGGNFVCRETLVAKLFVPRLLPRDSRNSDGGLASYQGAMMKDTQDRFRGTLNGSKARRIEIEKHSDPVAIFVSLQGEPMRQLGPPITMQ